jgi:hypothetical protein
LFLFGSPRSCRHPAAIFGTTRGCPPVLDHGFLLAAGREGQIKFSVRGLHASDLVLAIVLNGRRRFLEPLGRVSRLVPLPPTPQHSSITATCPGAGTLGSAATITGSLAPAGPPVPVTLSYIGPGAGGATTVLTAATGAYTAQFAPTTPGTWTVQARFAGDRTRLPVLSSSCSFQVAKQPVSLTIQCPSQVAVGSSANVSGRLSPTVFNAKVTIDYQPPSGAAIEHTTSTDGNGTFHDSVTPSPNQPGQWTVSASWPGDATHQRATGGCVFSVS